MCRPPFGAERGRRGSRFLDCKSAHERVCAAMPKFDISTTVTKPGIAGAYDVCAKHCVRCRVMHE